MVTLTSLGILGPGGGIVEPARDAGQAISNYMLRLWKISNHWRMPPTVVRQLNKPKILIVLSDTGGGHKASASPISSALELLKILKLKPWMSSKITLRGFSIDCIM